MPRPAPTVEYYADDDEPIVIEGVTDDGDRVRLPLTIDAAGQLFAALRVRVLQARNRRPPIERRLPYAD